MSPVSPHHLDRLGVRDRARLGAEILATYVRVRWTLRSQDAAHAVVSLRTHARRYSISSEPGMDYLVGWRLAHAVNVTLRPLPTDVRCLFRSLTLLTVMERRALHPKLIIGVTPAPFSAHAWVELNGEPLLPAGEHDRLTEL
jgi:hypothetical protein